MSVGDLDIIQGADNVLFTNSGPELTEVLIIISEHQCTNSIWSVDDLMTNYHDKTRKCCQSVEGVLWCDYNNWSNSSLENSVLVSSGNKSCARKGSSRNGCSNAERILGNYSSGYAYQVCCQILLPLVSSLFCSWRRWWVLCFLSYLASYRITL